MSTSETFTKVINEFKGFLATPDRTRTEVTAELERTTRKVRTLAEGLRDIDQPRQAEARAQVTALLASLWQSATNYLAGQAPVISYITVSQTTTMDIAKERYLDPERAGEIERLNSISDPLNIPPGTELKIYAY